MSKLIRCIEGHVYDTEAHAACPVCGSIPGIDHSGRGSDGESAHAPEQDATKPSLRLLDQVKTLSASSMPALPTAPFKWLAGVGGAVLVMGTAIYVLSSSRTHDPIAQNGEPSSEDIASVDHSSDAAQAVKADQQSGDAPSSGNGDTGISEKSKSDAQEQNGRIDASDAADSKDNRNESTPARLRWAGPDAPPSAYSKDVIALHERAGKHLSKGDFDSAIADYTDIIRRGSATWSDFNGRGLAYHYKKQVGLALADYNRAIERRGHNEFVHYNRSVAYKEQGQAEKALADLDAAIDKHGSTTPDHYLARADTYLKRSEFAKAIKDYDKMVDLVSKDKDANAESKAFAFFARGRAKEMEVLSEHKKCDEEVSKRAGCNNPMALMAPLIDYEAALAVKPDYAQALFKIGWISGELGNMQEALESYTKAIKIDPTFSMAYANRCVVYTVMKEMELALADCNDAIRHDPKNYAGWTNRGVIFATKRGQKNRRQAISDLRHALQIQPGYPIALEALRRMGVKP